MEQLEKLVIEDHMDVKEYPELLGHVVIEEQLEKLDQEDAEEKQV